MKITTALAFLLVTQGLFAATDAVVDFEISVPADLSTRGVTHPTAENKEIIRKALDRILNCPVLNGVQDKSRQAYLSGCFTDNHYILFGVLAASVKAYAAYPETFNRAVNACDTWNMRSSKSKRNHFSDSNQLFEYVGTNGKIQQLYGLEKKCTDSYLDFLKTNIELVYLK